MSSPVIWRFLIVACIAARLVTFVGPRGSRRWGRGWRRSFRGGVAWASGGVGRLVSEGARLESVTMGAGVARRDWRERQVVMMLAKEVCKENARGLAGGGQRESRNRGWDEYDASRGSVDGRSMIGICNLWNRKLNTSIKIIAIVIVSVLLKRAGRVVGVWCDWVWDRGRGQAQKFGRQSLREVCKCARDDTSDRVQSLGALKRLWWGC
jgi:hypothetical protein